MGRKYRKEINDQKEDKEFCVDFTVPVQVLYEVEPDFISKYSQKRIVNFVDTYLSNISYIDEGMIDA